jgi:hypothetical protein
MESGSTGGKIVFHGASSGFVMISIRPSIPSSTGLSDHALVTHRPTERGLPTFPQLNAQMQVYFLGAK